jgi:hypothetical protein
MTQEQKTAFINYCEEQKKVYAPYKTFKGHVSINLMYNSNLKPAHISVTGSIGGALICPKEDAVKHIQTLSTIVPELTFNVSRKEYKTIKGATKAIQSI